MLTDPSLFADVADALGIKSPVIVEKDYYAVQLIKTLSSISFEDYSLVFSGGTCLAKHIEIPTACRRILILN